MKKSLLLLVVLAVAAAAHAQKLTLQWSTDTLLKVPESVLYDPSHKILYAACIDGKPDEKDGKGSIARVTLDGKIENATWCSGLDAPKGMGIYKNNLYVADVTNVDVIDLNTGKLTAKIPAEGSVFLNDVTVDKQGVVYVSDSRSGKIYSVKDNKASVYFESTEFKGVNGLLAQPNGELYVVDFGNGFNYTLAADKKLTKFTVTSEGADGVVNAGKDGHLVSNWHGEVYYVNKEGQATKILDTKDQKVSAADIEFDNKNNVLYVPTFFSNKVMAYKLTW